MSREIHDKLVDAGMNPDRVLPPRRRRSWASSTSGLIPRIDWLRLRDSSRHGQSSHPCRALPAHCAGRVCRVHYGPGIPRPATRTRLSFSARASSGRTNGGSRFSPRRKKWKKHLSRRLDSDKIVFSPRLNPSQMDALRNAQTAEAIRLQQLHQSIRNLEASIAAKRKSFRAEAERELCLAAGWTARAESGARCGKTRRRLRPPVAAGNAEPSFQDQGAIPRRPQTLRADSRDSILMPIQSPVEYAHRQQNALWFVTQQPSDASSATWLRLSHFQLTIRRPLRSPW